MATRVRSSTNISVDGMRWTAGEVRVIPDSELDLLKPYLGRWFVLVDENLDEVPVQPALTGTAIEPTTEVTEAAEAPEATEATEELEPETEETPSEPTDPATGQSADTDTPASPLGGGIFGG